MRTKLVYSGKLLALLLLMSVPSLLVQGAGTAVVSTWSASSSAPTVTGNGQWSPNTITAGTQVGIDIQGELSTPTAGVNVTGTSTGFDGVEFFGTISGSYTPRFVVDVDYAMTGLVVVSAFSPDQYTYSATSEIAFTRYRMLNEDISTYTETVDDEDTSITIEQTGNMCELDDSCAFLAFCEQMWLRLEYKGTVTLSINRPEVAVIGIAREKVGDPIGGDIQMWDYDGIPTMLDYREVQ
jgi:hypothetical protein